MPFHNMKDWDHDTKEWALQVYDDPCENNNHIYREGEPGGSMGSRWGYGLPDHMAYQSDPCGLLKAAKALLPELSDRAWLHFDGIQDPIADSDAYITLWVHRNYGSGPVVPPDTQPNNEPVDCWLFLGSFGLSEEQECPDHGPGCMAAGETALADCPYCEGSQYVYHGSGYMLQVWGALKHPDEE